MAEENLGTAVLKIEVDDKQARNALKLLRQDVENAGISKSVSSSSSKQTKAERDLEVLKEKRFRLARRIEALEDKGVNVSRLRTQLGRLTTAYAERDFTLARNTARELARQATLAERTEKRRARAARSAKAEADESIRSARGLNRVNIDGSLREVGSPRFVTRGARQGGQAESLDALTAAQKRRYSLDQQIRSLEAAGVRTDQLRVRLGEATTAQANRQFGTFNRLADSLNFTLRKERDKLKVLQDQNREYERIAKLNVAPIRGGAAFPGSPAFLDAIFPKATRRQFEEAAKEIRQAASAPLREVIQERRAQQRSLQTAGGGGLTSFLRDVRQREESEKRISAERANGYKQAQFAERTLGTFVTRRERTERRATSGRLSGAISSGLIGGAFPLLFGQGGGAAAGGLAGGLIGGAFGGGGGFAGSLVGTLVGQQLDIFNQLAKALEDPVTNFKQLVEASNLSSKGLERYAQTLIDLGQTAQAEAVIRQDIGRTIDPTTLATTNAANDQYARTLADVQERLGAILAGPASNFISWLDEIIRRSGLLPGAGQGPAPGEARNRLGIANRGAGAALGLGGIGIAALGVAAAPFTGGASLLPAAIAGGGLAAAGAFQTQVGASLQDQAAAAELLKGVQTEILAIEQKRVAVQSKLLNAQQQGLPGQTELQVEVQLADVEARRARAKESFYARDLSSNSIKQYQLELEALKLTEEQIKANEALRKRSVDAQRSLATTQSSITLSGINEQIAATKALANAEKGVARETLNTIQNVRASVQEARNRQQLLLEQINTARKSGDTEGADTLAKQLPSAAAEIERALRAGSLTLKEATEKLADNAKAVRESFRSSLESSFGLLRRADQIALLNQARTDLRAADVFDPAKVARLRPRDLLSAASSARSIVEQRDILAKLESPFKELSNANTELNNSINNLNKAVVALSNKDWEVYITTNYSGSAQRELLAAASLP